MDIGQEQQQQQQKQSAKLLDAVEECGGEEMMLGRSNSGPQVVVDPGQAMEVDEDDDADDVPPLPPNAVERRGPETGAVDGRQTEAGCVTAGVENTTNNNNTVAASGGGGVGGSNGNSVEEQIPAIGNRYVLHGKIDRGTFSTVTLATRRDEQHLPMDKRRMYAIKLITQTSHPARIEREIRCMLTIGGQCNVVEIVDALRHQGSVGLVMNYIPHEPFHGYYALLGPAEVQQYLRQLLIALDRVHQHGVIHRDVKPSNFLHSRRNGGSYMLVDFGLAQETLAGGLKLCPPARVAEGPKDKRKELAAEPLPKRHKQLPKGDSNNPLKQPMPLKVSNNTLKDLVQSPLARQVKSAAVGIESGLKSRRSVPGGGGSAIGGTPSACDGRENSRRDLEQAPPPARQVKATAAGVGGGLKHHHRQSPAPAASASASASPTPLRCECYGRAQVCNRCLVKRELQAPRAGTPGYRPPEVLLKYPEQTTAVDVWAAGVIFLSLLSKCYPFFGNTDDMKSLAQIISVFGFERVHQTARNLDRTLIVSEETARMKALSLRRVCQHFRALFRKRECPTGTGAAPSGGSSPPGGDDAANGAGGCCSNCVQPPEGCLCQEPLEAARAASGNKDDPESDDGTDCDEYGPAAYDLLERLLDTDPHTRITAAEALSHPYFEVQY